MHGLIPRVAGFAAQLLVRFGNRCGSNADFTPHESTFTAAERIAMCESIQVPFYPTKSQTRKRLFDRVKNF